MVSMESEFQAKHQRDQEEKHEWFKNCWKKQEGHAKDLTGYILFN